MLSVHISHWLMTVLIAVSYATGGYLYFFSKVLHHLTHTRTGSFFFLQVYYARITEFLRFQPSPLQRSFDTG